VQSPSKKARTEQQPVLSRPLPWRDAAAAAAAPAPRSTPPPGDLVLESRGQVFPVTPNDKMRSIGSGGVGSVYKVATPDAPHPFVAVKEVVKPYTPDRKRAFLNHHEVSQGTACLSAGCFAGPWSW
jgi:hypothetical protein